tara:strand:- start:2192 stop:2923 length:732 start_codon:yes stop_codon:yes gene_type:complete
MAQKIKKGFILAAGQGKRMRPLTDTCPKPLLKVAGKPIIEYALDALKERGVSDVVVNLNYLGEQLEDYLNTCSDFNITLSWEHEFLETGGGVERALHHFGDEAFFVLNGDVIWDGGSRPALKRLEDNWDSDKMDALLLMQPIEKQDGYHGKGDYHHDADTLELTRRTPDQDRAPLVFAGPRIIHPRLFNQAPQGAYSFLTLFDQAQEKNRLYGVVHDGNWYHVGTPDSLEKTDRILRDKAARD